MTSTVLVVEDNKTERIMIKELLEEKGYNVVTAEDGETALGMIGEAKPQLILLDVVLPRMNGFEVCREIKTTAGTQAIKVVMVTSKTQESDRYWGMKQGADAYLPKPFKEADLLSLVAKLV